MNFKTSSERMGDAVARARRHWQTFGKSEVAQVEAPAPAAPSFTIAISRQAGAGGSALARAVSEKLGWPIYDKELIEKIAEEMGLRTQLVQSVDERRGSWLEECLHSLTARRSVSEGAYVHYLSQVLLSLAAHGNCVIVGRGAAQILPEATTLRVRLVGPYEKRVAAIEERHDLGRVDAEREVKETDQRRRRFVMDHFHKDADDPALYDLVLNSGRLDLEDCTALIVHALERLKRAQVPTAVAAR
jgi:cytidylate kinase